MRARISEIFGSIQGEGLYLGERQLFVRFFDCNLSCQFCDTKSDYFIEYEPEELLKEIRLYKNDFHSISFTGGEPLLYSNFLKEVLELMRKKNYRTYLETNGTLSDELKKIIHYLDIIAMDLKLPSSTGLVSFWQAHRKFLDIASSKEVFLKAVICQSTTEDDLREGLNLIKEINRSAILVLQPNSYEKDGRLIEKLERFKNICRKEKVTACIIEQLHKVIGLR